MNHILYIGLLILSLPLFTRSICYFPDGTIPRQDTPCQSEGESTCCGAGYACLSNNLCKLTEHVPNPASDQSEWVRGSCTDRSWKSPNCPNFCVTPSNGDNASGGMGVEKCSVAQDRYYCINNQTLPLNTSDICTSSLYFFQFAGTPSTATVIGVPNTSTSSTTTTLSVEPTKEAISTSSASLSTAPISTTIPSSEQRPKDKDYSVPIGAGVGVPLGVIALAVVAYLAFRRRRAAKQIPDTVHNPMMDPRQSHIQHKVQYTPQSTPAAYHDQPEWVPLHEMPAGNNQR